MSLSGTFPVQTPVTAERASSPGSISFSPPNMALLLCSAGLQTLGAPPALARKTRISSAAWRLSFDFWQLYYNRCWWRCVDFLGLILTSVPWTALIWMSGSFPRLGSFCLVLFLYVLLSFGFFWGYTGYCFHFMDLLKLFSLLELHSNFCFSSR